MYTHIQYYTMFLIYVVLNGMKSPCCPLLVCRTWQLQLFTSPSHSGRSSRTSGSVMQTLLVACAGPGQGCKGGRWQQIFRQKMWQVPNVQLAHLFGCMFQLPLWIQHLGQGQSTFRSQRSCYCHVSDPVLCTSKMAMTNRSCFLYTFVTFVTYLVKSLILYLYFKLPHFCSFQTHETDWDFKRTHITVTACNSHCNQIINSKKQEVEWY